MSMNSYIASLKEKPEHVRKQYAFWSSFALSFVVFAFWLGSFTGVNKQVSGQVATAVGNAGTPTQSLVAGVGDFAKDIWSMFVKPKTVQYSEIEVIPGDK